MRMIDKQIILNQTHKLLNKAENDLVDCINTASRISASIDKVLNPDKDATWKDIYSGNPPITGKERVN